MRSRSVRTSPVIITDHALEKMCAYAALTSLLAGIPTEVMGFITSSRNLEACIGDDICLVDGQTATCSDSVPRGNAFSKTYAQVKTSGGKVVGMWHSHGMHPVFHSRDDDNFLRNLLFNNRYFLQNNIEIGGDIYPYASSVVINHTLYDDDIPAAELARGTHYYACAGIRDKYGSTKILHDLPLEVIPTYQSRHATSEPGTSNIDYSDMLMEIFVKVNFCSRSGV